MKKGKIFFLIIAIFVSVSAVFGQAESQEIQTKVDEYMNAFVKAKKIE